MTHICSSTSVPCSQRSEVALLFLVQKAGETRATCRRTAATMSVSLNIDPGLLKTYVFWGTILIVKVLLMAFLTGRQRMSKKVRRLWTVEITHFG